MLQADLGVAIIPTGALQSDGLCRIPLTQLDLVRSVSLYTVVGRQRATACATLFNMLRAADWESKQPRRAH